MQITLTRPDDWHLHVRDGAEMASVLPDTARRFARAVIMPNLQPPVATTEQALAYRRRIARAVPEGVAFEPLMTLYWTAALGPTEIDRARTAGILGVKYYPAGATTHSDAGLRSLEDGDEVLAVLERFGLPLLVHGESTDPSVDVFDRETVFLERELAPVLERFPDLKVVVEHISTARAVTFVRAAGPRVGATITAHHLLYTRNDLLAGGIRPHLYCAPIVKQFADRDALIEAATSGESKFFLGTDSAPHARGRKENACGCAGVYTAHAAIELYAEVFEDAGALDRLEGFATHHGADFYGLARNTGTVALERESWNVPEQLPFGGATLVPLRARETVRWKLRA